MAIAVLGTGDVLMVTQPARLARSTRDLLNTLAAITDRKKAGFRSLGDAWAALTNSPRTSGERPPGGATEATSRRSMALTSAHSPRTEAMARLPRRITRREAAALGRWELTSVVGPSDR